MSVVPPETIYDEIIDFLVSAPTPEQIIAFKPPEKLQARLSALLEQNRQHGLSTEEQAELDEFLRMNRFMSRLKLRARQKIGDV
ncbi:MAG: hypothetical protein D6737_17160 [Chloroflexi bacterium]|nr:MAG: hypothetical protein D6737_17160 [Chloroflexota bacterium]